MIKLTPTVFQVEESSIIIEQTKPNVFVVREDFRYLNDSLEWSESPTTFNFEGAKKVVEDYFSEVEYL